MFKFRYILISLYDDEKIYKVKRKIENFKFKY